MKQNKVNNVVMWVITAMLSPLIMLLFCFTEIMEYWEKQGKEYGEKKKKYIFL